MKINKLIIGLLSFVGLLSVSCDGDFDEINKNPNATEEFSTSGLMTDYNRRMMSLRRGAFTEKMCRSWVQYVSQYSYTQESRFGIANNSINYYWYNNYVYLTGYKKIIELNEDEKTKEEAAKYGDNQDQIQLARLMMARISQELVDKFGDVPYYSHGSNNTEFQALNPEVYLRPVHASQEAIYLDLLKVLGEVSKHFEGKTGGIMDGDQIFGDKGKAYRYANSLRLRIANRVKNVSDATLSNAAKTVIDELKDGTKVLQEGENIGLKFDSSAPGYNAPLFTDYRTRLDYGPSDVFVDFMKNKNTRGVKHGIDPRLQKIAAPKGLPKAAVLNASYTPSENLDDYVGMPFGLSEDESAVQFDAGKNISLLSAEIVSQTGIEYLMEYSEVCFLLSEVNDWDDAWYRKGVQASMDRWGVDKNKAIAFVDALPQANEENVMTQKYVALYTEPEEGYAEYRRTKLPNILLPINGKGKYIVPMEGKTEYTYKSIYPTTEIFGRYVYSTQFNKEKNEENVKKALERMGLSKDDPTGKLIWAKK